MRSQRSVSTGLAHGIAPLSTCGGADGASRGVSPVDERSDASWLPAWLPEKRCNTVVFASVALVDEPHHHSPTGVTALLARTSGTEGHGVRGDGDSGDTYPR